VLVCVHDTADTSTLIRASWATFADAAIDVQNQFADVAAALGRLRRIEAAVSRLPALRADLPVASRRQLTLLRFLVTRELQTLRPRLDPGSASGHSYGALEMIAGPSLHSDLTALAKAGLVNREFFERLHTCPGCDDARLAFREVCGACRSADLRRGQVVHHYPCGHVAAEELFRHGEQLVCPSCAESLRHIGIDYERPASLLYCNSCALTAGEGVTEARCLACGTSHAAEAVMERTVFTYHVTVEGHQMAVQGAGPGRVAG
jgi:hypothetical protein